MAHLGEYYLVYFIIGALFLLFEAIVPGIGILGLMGLIFLIIGIVLVSPTIIVAIISIIIMLSVVIIVFVFFLKNLPGALILKKRFVKDEGFLTSKDNSEYIGKVMHSVTLLKPSGKVSYDGKLYDAITEGNFIDKNVKVKVINNKGSILVVKRVEE